ncbi:MAG: beta-ketoacyl-[acyl-carrier-protein] synthase II [Desulforudis sp.]|nr:beta-ketoacyl-ACP synthase II [Clostridia bacterium]RJX17850.1 MAG: beta-ketoacyl-[acyl-carrier-protein] synthase II [Desulforudis sp.]
MGVRAVITGMGIISPVGTGLEAFWQAITGGVSGIRRITQFDVSEFRTQIAGLVLDFEAMRYIEKKEARRMDRVAQFAVATAGMAIEDAGLNPDDLDGDRVGVVLGSGIGGMQTLEEQARILFERGPGRISPFLVPMMIGNMAAGLVALKFGFCGPNATLVTACASSNNAIGDAARMIERGEADVIIAGGTEAAVTPLALGGFCAMKATSARNDEPEKASRPFDAGRDGFVMAEGAAVLILESLEHAIKRNARIYAEFGGYGTSCDAYHMTAPEPEGRGAAQAMAAALHDAGVRPEEVDYINAHGTSTPLGDIAETKAVKRVFGGNPRLVVSSTKSMTGHLLGAAGGLEAIACVLSIQHGVIPPTINYDEPDPDCDLDYVPNKARQYPVKIALSNGFGFGGHNATLLFRKYEDGER